MDDLQTSRTPSGGACLEEQKAFIARGEAAFDEASKSGEFYTSDEVMAELDALLAACERGQFCE